MRYSMWLALVAGALACIPGGILGQAQKPSADDQPIVATLEKFAKAYNARDAKALAQLWSEKGEYLSLETGDRVEGRQAIENDFSSQFAKNKEARLEIDVRKIRRLGRDAAAVEGSTQVIRPEQPISRSDFQALLVRTEEGWLIDSVRELEAPPPDTIFEKLQQLAWMDGAWKHQDGDTEVSVTCRWVANGNFRSHRFSVRDRGEVLHEGTQIIGWDPVKKQLRSWVFGSDGSFGEGEWQKTAADRWTIKVSGLLQDGQKSAAVQVLTKKDKDHYVWQVVDRSVSDRVLPNVDPVVLERVASTEKKED